MSLHTQIVPFAFFPSISQCRKFLSFFTYWRYVVTFFPPSQVDYYSKKKFYKKFIEIAMKKLWSMLRERESAEGVGVQKGKAHFHFSYYVPPRTYTLCSDE